jgi:hypothetical protein
MFPGGPHAATFADQLAPRGMRITPGSTEIGFAAATKICRSGHRLAHARHCMVTRAVVHGERRAREMEEVAEAFRSIGLEPIMAAAAARRMDWSAKQDLKARFGPNGPATLEEFAEKTTTYRECD